MENLGDVSKEKLEYGCKLIRKDVAYLQRDLGYAEQNRARWIFIIMWIVVANLLWDASDLPIVACLGLSVLLIGIYRFFDRLYIKRRALRSLKEPLEPMWDTDVDLS